MSQLLNQGPFGVAGDWFDRQLIQLNVLPARTRTDGKSLIFTILFALMIFGTVHFHFGYLNFLLACIPCGLVLALMYAEAELRKED